MPDLASMRTQELLRSATDCAVLAASTVDRGSQIVPLGTCESRTAFRIASLTKPFTAAAVVLACLRTGPHSTRRCSRCSRSSGATGRPTAA